MKFLHLFLTLLTFTCITNLSAQQKKCASAEHTATLMEDPAYQQNFRERMAAFNQVAQQRTAQSRLDCEEVVTIPVAIHFQGISSNDRACLEDLVEQQITTLNDDFQGVNPDIESWTEGAASFFPGVSNGETCVEFCVATTNHPAGYNLTDGQMAITINQTTGDRVGDWSGYMNIFVMDIGDNILGYSPLGGRGNGDGVVIAKFAFGGEGACGDVSTSRSLDRGRTLTHEIGHFFLLNHIWGDTGCNRDDGVADTPNSDGPNFGCPQNGKTACGSVDMHMNYMDYSNDECMYMFSAGQSTRMEDYVSSNLQSFVLNGANVCTPAEPTCDDGIQNGEETGIDCGAPDCPDCPEPTCDDGIQNGDETDIDCGGICAACPEPACNDGIQNGDETGVDCGGTTCSPCVTEPTCDDGIQNGEETGIDCGAPGCAECPTNCSENLVFVLIRPDNYGSETTWTIQDSAGNEMANGGPYIDFNREIIQEEVCLPTGCYTFTIFDAFADGICCEYGAGEYAIVDLNNNILASSTGQFSTSETKIISTGNSSCDTIITPPTDNLCTPAVPTSAEYFNNISRVRINWEAVPEANRYQIQYRESGFTDWSVVSTSRTRKTLRNLLPSTEYEIRFSSRCPEGWTTYGPVYVFSTLSGRVIEAADATQAELPTYEPIAFNKMYPNPTSANLNLDYELDIDGLVNITVYDMLGRRMIEQSLQQEEGYQKISLPTVNLQSGTYILHITTENQQIIRKFIKD